MARAAPTTVTPTAKWFIGTLLIATGLLGGFVGRLVELGATYATHQDVAKEVEHLRSEFKLAQDVTAANFQTIRAEMAGMQKGLEGQLEAMRAEVRASGKP